MPIVWRYGRVTVRQVFEELYESKRLAYTTVMTVMNRLSGKGVLSVDKRSVPFVYQAIMNRRELAATVVDEVVNRLLEGAPAPLVLHYLEHGKMSAREQGAVHILLNSRKEE